VVAPRAKMISSAILKTSGFIFFTLLISTRDFIVSSIHKHYIIMYLNEFIFVFIFTSVKIYVMSLSIGIHKMQQYHLI